MQRTDVIGANVTGGYLPWLETAVARGMGDPAGAEREAGDLAAGLAGLIHDARNMVTAIELYCGLLDEPDEVTEPYRHYAQELRTVSAASRRLLERLGGMESAARYSGEKMATAERRKPLFIPRGTPAGADAGETAVADERCASLACPGRGEAFLQEERIANLAEELRANQNLLRAVAGHGVTLELDLAGDGAVEMTREDLTRMLVNLTRNASEAMAGSGELRIALDTTEEKLSLRFTDTGTGIAPEMLETIFAPGVTAHGSKADQETGQNRLGHRGLGLAIVRSLAASVGGAVCAGTRSEGRGAVFTVTFPNRDKAG